MADAYEYGQNAPGGNTEVPMRLSHEWPMMVGEAKERIQSCLSSGCGGWLGFGKKCSHETATIALRDIRGTKRVELQCDGCGRSLSGAIAKTMFSFGWKNLAPWNEQLCRQREMEEEIERKRFRTDLENAAYERDREREDYLRWCQTSPEWHALSAKVMWRSRGWCEACLEQKATTVHHLTYRYGKLPPAWELRAVCRPCHDRLHADRLGLSDEWAENRRLSPELSC